MHRAILERVIADLQQEKKDLELFSKEYFFDVRNAEHRSAVALWGGPLRHRTRLSLLLREGMTEEHRRSLFPGTYDLGNMKSLLPQFCKLHSDANSSVNSTLAEELTSNLWQENKLTAAQAIDRNNLKKIKAGIVALTGRTMQWHYAYNKSTALKVIKLFYRLSNDRWSSDGDSGTSKKPQLIAMLRWPTEFKSKLKEKKDYSLSFRDAYPYKKNTDQVWLIADLKTYLSVELDDETYEKIGALQFFLEDCLRTTEHNVKNALNSLDYTGQVKAYQRLADGVKRFEVKPQLAEIALDEELYFYLNALEFAHFAFGYADLLEKAKSDRDVAPIFLATERLAKDLVQDGTTGMHDPVIALEEIPSLIQVQSEILGFLVTKALQTHISLVGLKKLTDYVCNLLCTYAMFVKQVMDGGVNAPVFSILELVAAICCICDELTKKEKERTKCKPYWKGQEAQGGSILTSLETAPINQNWRKDPLPEEHRHIWTNRFEWFMAALQGQAECKTQQFMFRSALAKKIGEISRTNNLVAINHNLAQLRSSLATLVNPSF